MKTRKIRRLELGSFKEPVVTNNPQLTVRVLWYLLSALFFQGSILGLIPSRTKILILRLFGAQVGKGVVIKPNVEIKSPWFLQLGNNVWIGQRVWIDNHTLVRIGSNSCISQGAYIFTGNHDWNDPAFSFFCEPVEIGESVWITAFCRITPGSIIESETVVFPS